LALTQPRSVGVEHAALTNTYLEGAADLNDKAQHARSKEKRNDCPLITLGLVLDGSGFVRRSKSFEGNVTEGPTLQLMLDGLKAPYVLEFLELPESHGLVESHIEEALISRLKDFLLELGSGFAFIGPQVRLTLRPCWRPFTANFHR
jgi:hypothetical protein